MSDYFSVGDEVRHTVEEWGNPVGALKVCLVKNLVVIAIDENGNKYTGTFNCFELVKRN